MDEGSVPITPVPDTRSLIWKYPQSALRFIFPGLFRKRKPIQFSVVTLLVLISITSAFIAANIKSSGTRELVHRSQHYRTILVEGWGWPFPSYRSEEFTRKDITPEKLDEEIRLLTFRDAFPHSWSATVLGWLPIHVFLFLFLDVGFLICVLVFAGALTEYIVRHKSRLTSAKTK